MRKKAYRIINKVNDEEVTVVGKITTKGLKTRASRAFPDSKCVWVIDNKDRLILQKANDKWTEFDIDEFRW